MKAVFDIGGTFLRVARALPGGVSEARVEATPQDPEAGVKLLASLLQEIAQYEALEAVAGGVAGTVKDGVILISPNLPGWSGFPFGGRLSALLHSPVFIENDADSAALGEALYGRGKGMDIVAYLGIGTGVGGGRVVRGAIDAHAFGFEPGHQILDTKEKRTLEELVSGGALERLHGMKPGSLPRSVYEELEPTLAVGIYNTIAHWSPDALIVGGSLINDRNGFRIEKIKAALEELPWRFPLSPVIPGALPGVAGLYGARALLDQRALLDRQAR